MYFCVVNHSLLILKDFKTPIKSTNFKRPDLNYVFLKINLVPVKLRYSSLPSKGKEKLLLFL